MVSELDQKEHFLQHLSQSTAFLRQESPFPLGRLWVSDEGMAANGIKYAPPSDAIRLGEQGLSILRQTTKK